MLLAALESSCYGNKSAIPVFCQFSMMTVIVPNKCWSDEYWGVKNKTLPSRLEPCYFSPGCSGREELCGAGKVAHVRLGGFVHPACVSLAVPFGLGCWEMGWGFFFFFFFLSFDKKEPSNWNRSMEAHFCVESFWKLQLCDMPPSQLCAVLAMFPTWNLQWGNKEIHLSLWAQRCSQLLVKENL